jgi:amino acid permease
VGATAWVAAAVAVGALALPHLAVHVLVPCLMALVLARRAAQAGGTSRMVVGAVAVGLVLCGAAAFQPPESVPEAAAWGILVVAAFWAVMARWPTTVQEVVR